MQSHPSQSSPQVSDLRIDASLTPFAGTGQDTAPSSSRQSGPGSPQSLLDDWENWPEKDTTFNPVFHNAWPLRTAFCNCKGAECSFCSETRQVFHVSEYTADGQSVMDTKVNTPELHEHLRELEQLDKSDVKTPHHQKNRLFFACGNYGAQSLKFAYLRHFLAYSLIPPHFVLRMEANDCLPVFQAAYEPAGANEPQRGILHICLQSLSYVMGTDMLAHPEYYSSEFLHRQTEKIRGAPGFWTLSPSLDIRYDESSRQSVVYIADDARTFDGIRSIVSATARDANQDPFLLVGIFIQHRLAELRKYVRSKQEDIDNAIKHASDLASRDTNSLSSALFKHFGFLGTEGLDYARMAQGASSMLRALGAIEAEHRLFLAREGNSDAQAYAAWYSQNQARATERFSEGARNDSRILRRDSVTIKTITIVTLIYLPATFVSTLLSMGLFDFGLGDNGDGHLRIARQGWIFLAISLPLTLLTLGFAYIRIFCEILLSECDCRGRR